MVTDRPDYYISIVMHGKHGTTFVPVAVDVDGNMLGILQGQYDTTPTPIAVDEDGVMRANLVAQELTRMISRISYGGARRADLGTTVAPVTTHEYNTIIGQGITYGGFIWLNEPVSHVTDVVTLVFDGKAGMVLSFIDAWRSNQTKPTGAALWSPVNDDIFFRYCMMIAPGITFDEKLEIKYRNNHATDGAGVLGSFYYALTD